MSEDQNDVDVVVEEPAKASEPDIEVKVDDEKPSKVEKSAPEPDDAIQALKKRLDAEKYARQEAEKRAHMATQQVAKAQSEVNETNYHLVSNALETVKARSEQLKSAYSEAMGMNDFARAAEIQQAMATNASQMDKLKQGKKEMKQQLRALKNGERQPIAPMQHNVDPIEQMASAVSPKSASWLRYNRDNLKDDRAIRKMFRAHEDAIEDGIEPDSDDYFKFIEGRLGINRDDSQDTSSSRKSAPPPAAPVSRGNGQRPGVVRLTREQADMAKTFGMSETDYAKQVLALQKEGKLGH